METLSLPSQIEFRRWLKKNYDESSGIWLRLWKASSGTPSLTYAEALDQALCFGWIDSQKKSYDSDSWVQKFTPRKSGSRWSKKNTEHVERLIKTKKMMPAGLRAVKQAKDDGRWKAAYESSRTAKIPPDFLKEIARNKKAKAAFALLNKTNLYSIYYRLQSAKKAETREKRMKAIIAMLASGEKFR